MTESFRTLLAFIRLFTHMHLIVNGQTGILSKGFGAWLALVACVHSNVVGQGCLPREGFRAQFTVVRFFTCVRSIVEDQCAILSKGFGALLTFVRLFIRVYSTVRSQTVSLSKGFRTLIAFVRFFTCVCSNVLGQA
uniref:Putative homeobox transcription factor sip1 n=1 Tax=Ixodes ricinus TaxID=34613 RepID=A0A6B0US98_IXORI